MSTEKESPNDQIKKIIAEAEKEIAKRQEQLDNIPNATDYRLEYKPPGSVPSTYSFWRKGQEAKLKAEIENIKIDTRENCNEIIKGLSKEEKEIADKDLNIDILKVEEDLEVDRKKEKDFSASQNFMQKLRHKGIETEKETDKSKNKVENKPDPKVNVPANYFSQEFMKTRDMNFNENKEAIPEKNLDNAKTDIEPDRK